MAQILSKILKKISPGKKEIEGELGFADSLIEKIKSFEGEHADVVLAGSLARDTHLKGDRDIDIFVLFPEKLGRKDFEREGLRIGKKIFRGHTWVKAYSEHPYIRGVIDGFNVEIVPSYKVEKAEMLKSSVDRSPFHAEYVRGKLKDGQKDEVRLLRQFLKGIGAYGADLRMSSVPGYVVELLIIKYGSFEKALKGISNWGRNEVIDLENYLGKTEAVKNFDSPLIVVDPVDRNRNVAAALSLNQFSRIVAASRAFLEKPSEKFFFPRKEKPWSVKKVKEILGKKELLAVEIGYPKVLEDILWGQIRRLRKKIVSQLEGEDFMVIRSEEWLEEGKRMLIVIELESLILQRAAVKVGPEVTDKDNSERFLDAHKKVVAGPRIEKGRWVLEVERKYGDARNFISDFIKKLKKAEKENVRKALRKRAVVLDEKGIVELYKRNKGFREFLTVYLKGKEEFE